LALPHELAQFPAIEQSAGEAFRPTHHGWVADDENSPPEAYAPLQADGLVWVAEADGELIGFGAGEAFEDAIHLWELAVAHAHQGRGAGRALMAALVEEAGQRRAPAITLTTFSDIPWNAPFYARLGFEILAQPNARLEATLAKETARGLTSRCAMRLALRRP